MWPILWKSFGVLPEVVTKKQCRQTKRREKSCCLLAAGKSKGPLASDSDGVSCWFFDSWIFSSSWLQVANIPIGFSLPTEIKILQNAILSKSLASSQKTQRMFSYASLSSAIVSISMPSQIFLLCIT